MPVPTPSRAIPASPSAFRRTRRTLGPALVLLVAGLALLLPGLAIAYLASEISGLASVTAGATDAAGRPLADAERFDAVVALVRAVTTSPQGPAPKASTR